jgi:hypothetical protein
MPAVVAAEKAARVRRPGRQGAAVAATARSITFSPERRPTLRRRAGEPALVAAGAAAARERAAGAAARERAAAVVEHGRAVAEAVAAAAVAEADGAQIFD